jgi:hypothetical protein
MKLTLLFLACLFALLESYALWRCIRRLEYIAKPAVMVCLFIWLYLSTGLVVWCGHNIFTCR